MATEDTSVLIELDAYKFMREIAQWSVERTPFRTCLLTALLYASLFREAEKLTAVLAEEFEIGSGTVLRWAQGVETPHILTQRRVVAAISRELELALTPVSLRR